LRQQVAAYERQIEIIHRRTAASTSDTAYKKLQAERYKRWKRWYEAAQPSED
jgi:hypothetical protein